MSARRLSEHLYLHRDTCNVYVLRGVPADAAADAAADVAAAVLVDFGDGSVLDELPALGIQSVAAVLMTHHHRDQGQGLARAVAAGIPIWAPHAEQDLFERVDAHWQARELYHNYNAREDRFSLLEPVPLAGTLRDYAVVHFVGRRLVVLPTPGHTPGSITLLAEVDGRQAAFTGDLLAGPGHVWSLAAMQWNYAKMEGAPATIASLLDLSDRGPDVLLPSHGDPIAEPTPAIEQTAGRLRALLDGRGENPRLSLWRREPYLTVGPQVLWNRTSLSYSYVLLAGNGHALLIDYGYDFMTGLAAGADRAAHRPWLYTLGHLKRAYGVTHIDAVIPTHYHDDHVAGCNLLRDVEGTQIWAAENYGPVLADPARFDLPCLWYEPVIPDRVLPLGVPFEWAGYQLTLHGLPGHTRYAAALAFTAGAQRYLATGDEFEGEGGEGWNYIYRGGFDPGDYLAAARLCRELRPDIILPGHWQPYVVTPAYLDRLEERGRALLRLHSELLGDEHSGAACTASLHPYQMDVQAGAWFELEARIARHAVTASSLTARIVLPPGWRAEPLEAVCTPAPGAEATLAFRLQAPEGTAIRRARVAVDLTAGGVRLGQLAEALVTVRQPGPSSLAP